MSKHKFVGSFGHVSEDETGLIYTRARYMDPALGRFISEDPAGDGANWFVYCESNPVNLVDADGRSVLNSWGVDLTVGGILILLGRHLIRHSEREALAYVLGVSGMALGGLLAIMAIKCVVDIVGPTLVRYIDRLSNEMSQSLERESQERASSLTERVTSVIYGRQMIAAGYMLGTGSD